MVIIDEADSILIDEARTPLIIGQQDSREERQMKSVCQWGAAHASRLTENEHYTDHGPQKGMELTEAGRRLVREMLIAGGCALDVGHGNRLSCF